MDRIVKVTKKGSTETWVGMPVCRGPATYRLVLTWPYQSEGLIAEIPVEDIESVEEAEAGSRHEEPRVLE